MGKYDDLFNEYFREENFGDNNERKELLKKQFSDLMKNFDIDSISDPSKFINPSKIKGLMNGVDDGMEWDRKDFPIISKEVRGVTEIDEMIIKYEMEIFDLSIKRSNFDYIITETWESEKGDYRLEQRYILDEDLINDKKSHIVEMIVDELVELGINKNNLKYISYLDDFSKNEIYKKLLIESIESEDYMSAATYRDLIQ